MPASRIGQLIGGRDHSTVLHSCSAVEQRLKVDQTFVADMNSIEQTFKLKH
jgi:chromosomal replication initiator protein